jgi:NAD-dependent histone deacetylase SIR2
LAFALNRISLRRREKLPQYNSREQAIDLLRTSRKIIVLSGAGISTSCGIPGSLIAYIDRNLTKHVDFRSANGIYAKLQDEGVYDLDDPQQMFDIEYFRRHPEVF